MKPFETKKLPETFYQVLAVVGAIVGAILLFLLWGIEWYQENDLELEYGIFSIFFIIIHLIPFAFSVLVGGLIGLFVGVFIATGIDLVVAKLCEKQIDASGKEIFFTNSRKIFMGVIVVFVMIPSIIITSRAIEKNHIRNEITDYLSSEYCLENIEVKFTKPYSDFYKYGVVIHSSNLDSLEYEKMTRIVYYLSSHTDIDSADVDVTCFVCGDDNYKIYTTSVFLNGEKVYEYKREPGYSVTSADAPYIGMDIEFIGSTKLGRPDKTELCRDYYALRPERRTITYKWYDSKGKMIYYAFAINGKITSVTDYRK